MPDSPGSRRYEKRQPERPGCRQRHCGTLLPASPLDVGLRCPAQCGLGHAAVPFTLVRPTATSGRPCHVCNQPSDSPTLKREVRGAWCRRARAPRLLYALARGVCGAAATTPEKVEHDRVDRVATRLAPRRSLQRRSDVRVVRGGEATLVLRFGLQGAKANGFALREPNELREWNDLD